MHLGPVDWYELGNSLWIPSISNLNLGSDSVEGYQDHRSGNPLDIWSLRPLNLIIIPIIRVWVENWTLSENCGGAIVWDNTSKGYCKH